MPANKKGNPPPTKKLKLNSGKPQGVALKPYRTAAHDWSKIQQAVLNRRGIVVTHAFKHGRAVRLKSVTTKHLHNDSVTNSKGHLFRKHNILSSMVSGSPLKFSRMMPSEDGKQEFARNAMRVIKGTQTTKGLTGDIAGVSKAIELASTIRISEANRGGTMAIFNAMTNLYRMKRGPLKASQWPTTYKGGGKGGAQKLRKLSFADAKHENAMRNIWKSYASKKDKWAGKSFAEWHAHKVTLWTKKASEAEFEAPKHSKTLKRATRDDRWSAIRDQAIQRRGVVLSHQFTLQDGSSGSLTTRHVHNDKESTVEKTGSEYQVKTHNVLTSVGEKRVNKEFGTLLTEGGPQVARNALRVLKNTQNRIDKGLFGTMDQAKSAVELAATIGVSETARGGALSLLNAASSLYLLKHQKLTPDQWNDPTVGYKGAGEGGAGRLRAMTKPEDAVDMERLKQVYTTHALTKPKYAKTSFMEWLQLKTNRWTSHW